MSSTPSRLRQPIWLRPFALPPHDLLRDATYRRLWLSILISSLGAQVTLLAIPLTAAVLLHATPTQMGLLAAMEIVPFVLLSLPAGVWLDRVRKLPVYVTGELLLAAAPVGPLGVALFALMLLLHGLGEVLLFAGGTALLAAAPAWRHSPLRGLRELPQVDGELVAAAELEATRV